MICEFQIARVSKQSARVMYGLSIFDVHFENRCQPTHRDVIFCLFLAFT